MIEVLEPSWMMDGVRDWMVEERERLREIGSLTQDKHFKPRLEC